MASLSPLINPPFSILKNLAERAQKLRFGSPVAYVYNPLKYAWKMHQEYVRRYGNGPRPVLLLGMNPGPWGMAQTGIPFGEVGSVRTWLDLNLPVEKPRREHPKRPVLGILCKRREVSGGRLWGWIQEKFKIPDEFFSRFFVLNYCPLMFLEASGKNLTPEQLPASQQAPLTSLCDQALRELAQYYKPQWVVGIGNFAQRRAQKALEGLPVRIGSILHPSPANPHANKNWHVLATRQINDLGISF